MHVMKPELFRTMSHRHIPLITRTELGKTTLLAYNPSRCDG